LGPTVPPNPYDKLGMHKCDYGDADQPLDWCSSARVREQLLTEIQALEDRLLALQDSEVAIDYSMRQTCREMIQSRQRFFLQLRR
jgi:hypothetical protein